MTIFAEFVLVVIGALVVTSEGCELECPPVSIEYVLKSSINTSGARSKSSCAGYRAGAWPPSISAWAMSCWSCCGVQSAGGMGKEFLLRSTSECEGRTTVCDIARRKVECWWRMWLERFLVSQ